MPQTIYDYTISVDFPNQKVNGTSLQNQIEKDASITTVLDFINVNVAPDICSIAFSDALSAAEKTALDAIVASHQGVLVIYDMGGVLPVGSVGVLPLTIVEDTNWQLIDITVTRPSFFSAVMTSLVGVANGCYSGDGGEIRVVEMVDGQADEDKTIPPVAITDTLGAEKILQLVTNIPPRASLTPNRYRIEARLNGATSLVLKSLNFGIVKFKVI